MYQLQDQVALAFNRTHLVGTIIGIDHYSMQNFRGGQCHWPSYTVVSSSAKPFDRYWFALWGRSEWILWVLAKKQEQGRLPLVLDKSGLAQIDLQGDCGPSTPVAALAQYKKGSRYFCIERFLGSKVMYFNGYKIQKPKVQKHTS